MINEPFVSIIIPTYNRETLLPNAIESVLNQNYSNWELIIVDDHSTDNTRIIVEKYMKKNQRINYFTNINRKGPAGARNSGIHYSKGQYIAFLDSDDEWLNHHLSDSIKAIQIGGVDICFSFWIVKKADELIKIFESDKNQMDLANAIKTCNPVIKGNYIYFNKFFFEFTVRTWFYCYQLTTMVIKSSLLKEIKFNEKMKAYEDTNLMNHLLWRNGFCLIRDYHLIYSMGESNIYFFINRGNVDVIEILADRKLINRLTKLGKYKIRMQKNKINIVKKSKYIKKKNKKICIDTVREYLFHVYFTLGFINKDHKKCKALKYYLQSLLYSYGIEKVSFIYIGKLLLPALFKKVKIELPFLDFF